MRKILIVVDMQNDFVTGSLGTPEAQAIVPRVLKKIMKCIDGGYYVYFTHDTHFDDPNDKDNYVDSLEGKYLPIKHCIENTNGWEIINELKDLESICTIITKYTFGSNGWQKGTDVWYGTMIKPLTPEFEQQIKEEAVVKKCNRIFDEKRKNLTFDQAVRILEVLEDENNG